VRPVFGPLPYSLTVPEIPVSTQGESLELPERPASPGENSNLSPEKVVGGNHH